VACTERCVTARKLPLRTPARRRLPGLRKKVIVQVPELPSGTTLLRPRLQLCIACGRCIGLPTCAHQRPRWKELAHQGRRPEGNYRSRLQVLLLRRGRRWALVDSRPLRAVPTGATCACANAARPYNVPVCRLHAAACTESCIVRRRCIAGSRPCLHTPCEQPPPGKLDQPIYQVIAYLPTDTPLEEGQRCSLTQRVAVVGSGPRLTAAFYLASSGTRSHIRGAPGRRHDAAHPSYACRPKCRPRSMRSGSRR